MGSPDLYRTSARVRPDVSDVRIVLSGLVLPDIYAIYVSMSCGWDQLSHAWRQQVTSDPDVVAVVARDLDGVK